MTEHLIERPLQPGICPRCRALVLAGHNAGILTIVDPAPLDRRNEMLALLAGRNTYDLITEGIPPRLYAEWRCSFRINGTRRHPVVAAHPCKGRGFTPAKPPKPPTPPIQPVLEEIPF
ncbi:hypothetical protein FH608_005500 [Nonomuraea phyllanthi]|uniref:Uncharacterized protein n=1 Tax=Nonomuraea phyllanthi TaxID=2219224 RepID=A0A5C4WRI5_9ACTN|nr:hypothetical protein [Nonomuraea phyllanthi]KAB8196232.1 hypothetical protein FH608_005500 [Nonomuraea phyllanthi]